MLIFVNATKWNERYRRVFLNFGEKKKTKLFGSDITKADKNQEKNRGIK
jgi:hypothetical protein